MKFVVPRAQFAAAAARAASAIPRSRTSGVLSGMLVTVDGQEVTLSGFDYDLSAAATIHASAASDGRLLLPGRVIAEIARRVPGDTVEVVAEGDEVRLRSGSATFRVPVMPYAEYPDLPSLRDAVLGAVPGRELVEAAAQTVFAVADDRLAGEYPAMMGVRLVVAGDEATLASTDTHRVSWRRLPWKAAAEADVEAVLPTRILAELKGCTSEWVQVAFGHDSQGEVSRVAFIGDDFELTARTIAGSFPAVDRFVSLPVVTEVTVDSDLLAGALGRADLVLDPFEGFVLEIGGDALSLTGGSQSQIEDEVAAVGSGEEVSVILTPRYLLDGVKASRTPVVRLCAVVVAAPSGARRHAVMVSPCEESGDAAYRYVCMTKSKVR